MKGLWNGVCHPASIEIRWFEGAQIYFVAKSSADSIKWDDLHVEHLIFKQCRRCEGRVGCSDSPGKRGVKETNGGEMRGILSLKEKSCVSMHTECIAHLSIVIIVTIRPTYPGEKRGIGQTP
jgi:hypothetical protein